MRMIVPITVTDSVLDSSSLAEEDTYSAWSSGTAYSTGDIVYVASTHRIYRAVTGSTGQDPTTDTANDYWLDIGATNKWKPFDGYIADPAISPYPDLVVTYDFTMPSFCDAIAFFGINAATIRVQVWDLSSPAVEIYDETQEVLDLASIVDWFTFFTYEPVYSPEFLFLDIPAYVGYRVLITIDSSREAVQTGGAPGGEGASGEAEEEPVQAEIGQIVIGRSRRLGVTLDGTRTGIVDYSNKTVDEFGRSIITQRDWARTVSYQFTIPTQDARRVEKILEDNRASPCVYFADEGMEGYGVTVYGFYDDFDIPLSAGGQSFAQLEIKGLT